AMAEAAFVGAVLLRASEPVTCVAFSPFDAALLAYGSGSRVTLASFAAEPLGLSELCSLHNGCAVTQVCWAPQRAGSGQLVAATAGRDHKLRIFTAGDGGSDEVLELAGHQAAVNQLAFDETGELLGSVSDDCTARLWSAQTGAAVRCVRLGSP